MGKGSPINQEILGTAAELGISTAQGGVTQMGHAVFDMLEQAVRLDILKVITGLIRVDEHECTVSAILQSMYDYGIECVTEDELDRIERFVENWNLSKDYSEEAQGLKADRRQAIPEWQERWYKTSVWRLGQYPEKFMEQGYNPMSVNQDRIDDATGERSDPDQYSIWLGTRTITLHDHNDEWFPSDTNWDSQDGRAKDMAEADARITQAWSWRSEKSSRDIKVPDIRIVLTRNGDVIRRVNGRKCLPGEWLNLSETASRMRRALQDKSNNEVLKVETIRTKTVLKHFVDESGKEQTVRGRINVITFTGDIGAWRSTPVLKQVGTKADGTPKMEYVETKVHFPYPVDKVSLTCITTESAPAQLPKRQPTVLRAPAWLRDKWKRIIAGGMAAICGCRPRHLCQKCIAKINHQRATAVALDNAHAKQTRRFAQKAERSFAKREQGF